MNMLAQGLGQRDTGSMISDVSFRLLFSVAMVTTRVIQCCYGNYTCYSVLLWQGLGKLLLNSGREGEARFFLI